MPCDYKLRYVTRDFNNILQHLPHAQPTCLIDFQETVLFVVMMICSVALAADHTHRAWDA